MDIAIPIFDRFTALDAIGPYEVLCRLPGAKVTWLAHDPGVYRTETGMAGIEATARLEDLPRPDVVMVPGGFGTRDLLSDKRMLDWIRTAHETSTWTTSVCTGSLLLAGAGLLDGLPATTHWLALEELRSLGAQPTSERVVFAGEKIVTAAGVSSGIDMALALVARLASDDVARAVQLSIEYDPQPPFDAGSTEKAGSELTAFVRAAAQGR